MCSCLAAAPVTPSPANLSRVRSSLSAIPATGGIVQETSRTWTNRVDSSRRRRRSVVWGYINNPKKRRCSETLTKFESNSRHFKLNIWPNKNTRFSRKISRLGCDRKLYRGLHWNRGYWIRMFDGGPMIIDVRTYANVVKWENIPKFTRNRSYNSQSPIWKFIVVTTWIPNLYNPRYLPPGLFHAILP